MDFIAKPNKVIDVSTFKASSINVEIFSVDKVMERKIGTYKRDYHLLHKTFHPFKQDDNYYALYSPNNKETRVMKLPSCDDYCAVEGQFSPVEYYVPSYDDMSSPQKDKHDVDEWNKQFKDIEGTFGFVSGCYWGDDGSWKIGFIDLSKLKDKIVKIDFRFGYISKPSNLSLSEAIDISDFAPYDEENNINICHQDTYDLTKHYYYGAPVILANDDETPLYNGINLNKLKKDELIKLLLGQKNPKKQ